MQFPSVPAFATSEIENSLAPDVAEHGEHAWHQVVIAVVVRISVRDPVVRDRIPGACRGVVAVGHRRSVLRSVDCMHVQNTISTRNRRQGDRYGTSATPTRSET